MKTKEVLLRDMSPAVKKLFWRIHWHTNINNIIHKEMEELSRQGKSKSSPQDKVTLPKTATTALPENKLDKRNKELWKSIAPFPVIPNCREFKIDLGEWNQVFKEWDIKRKEKPIITFEELNNGRFIRYYCFMQRRLQSTRDDNLYWLRVRFLLSHSLVFALAALASTFPRFHRELEYSKVVSFISGSLKLGKEATGEINYKRVYIDKANGGVRPLGVPTPTWRIYLKQLNWYLHLRFNHLIPAWQHGFRPKKGVLTAWRQILSEVYNKPYIYEFDLKNFFGSVDCTKVIEHLNYEGLVPEFCDELQKMSKQPAKLPKEVKISEFDNLLKMMKQSSTFKEFYPAHEVGNKIDQMMEGVPSLKAGEPSRRYSLGGLRSKPWEKGFPQGAAISPLLSILSLTRPNTNPLPPGVEIVMYADDGIIYSDSKFDEQVVKDYFEGYGIEISEPKSHWVRCGGPWLRDLNFLGLSLRRGRELWSKTRSGIEMKFDKQDLIKAVEISPMNAEGKYTVFDQDAAHEYALIVGPVSHCRVVSWHKSPSDAIQAKIEFNEWHPGYNTRVIRQTLDGVLLSRDIEQGLSWETLAQNSSFGWVLNRIWSGSWNSEVVQDFRLKGIPKSWLDWRGHLWANSLNFANSTSYAFQNIADHLREVRRRNLYKRLWKEGKISWGAYNDFLIRGGYGGLSEKSLALRPK